MVLMHTPAAEKNFKAPDFSLTGTDGNTHTFDNCAGENGTLIMFICNHCPYVIAIIDRLTQTCETLQNANIGCVAIMSNDTVNYPQDSFENMKLFATKHNFNFPYLIDETQEIARAYDAVCTPDFFGFDKNGILQYRGRLDSAANKPADNTTVPELLIAMRQIANGENVSTQQIPSIGCSIKWKS